MHTPSTSDILRYAILLIIILIIGLFTMSLLRKRREHKALVDDMRSVISESSYYQQFYAADARRTLLRAMHLLHQAEQGGQNPSNFLNEVLGVSDGSWLDRTDSEGRPASRAANLAEETLLTNYEHCRKLGLLDDNDALKDIAKGELPEISTGPASGERAEITTVIDPNLSPGIEKVVANLTIGPPRDKAQALGDVEIAAARRLARDLEHAGIIDSSALNRILARYDELAPK